MIAAIYSRKSKLTDKGESIDNQIELCKKYAKTHFQSNIQFVVYEDEGFSGGDTNRPHFQKLIKDAKAKKFDVLICYRLDRISRSVSDFSSTLEMLQNNSIDFISIKEQFDTSTPMGRAMVYISSVFAQLERETIAERIKDNMSFLAKSGRWLGGQSPHGYDTERIQYYDEEFNVKYMTKLIENDEELELVKLLFDLYDKTRSLSAVQRYCLSNSIKGKKGADLTHVTIRRILTNPVYVKSNEAVLEYYRNQGCLVTGTPNGEGLLTYGKTKAVGKSRLDTETETHIVAVSKHKGFLEPELFLSIQNSIDDNMRKSGKRSGTSKFALLSGMMRCSKCGAPMMVRYSYEKGKPGVTKYHYYACRMKTHGGLSRCDSKSISGPKIEEIIVNSILSAKDKDIIAAFNKKYKPKTKIKKIDNKTSLLEDVQAKTKTMDNLLNQLGQAQGPAANFIMDKVNALSLEIEQLKNNLQAIDENQSELLEETLNLELALSNLNEFKKIYKSLEHDAKKQLLNRLIDKIEIDVEGKIIDIHYRI